MPLTARLAALDGADPMKPPAEPTAARVAELMANLVQRLGSRRSTSWARAPERGRSQSAGCARSSLRRGPGDGIDPHAMTRSCPRPIRSSRDNPAQNRHRKAKQTRSAIGGPAIAGTPCGPRRARRLFERGPEQLSHLEALRREPGRIGLANRQPRGLGGRETIGPQRGAIGPIRLGWHFGDAGLSGRDARSKRQHRGTSRGRTHEDSSHRGRSVRGPNAHPGGVQFGRVADAVRPRHHRNADRVQDRAQRGGCASRRGYLQRDERRHDDPRVRDP